MQTSNIYYWQYSLTNCKPAIYIIDSINWQIANQQYILLTVFIDKIANQQYILLSVFIDKLQTSNIYYWQYLLTKLQTSNIYYWQYLLTNCKPAIYIIDSINSQISNQQYILLTVLIDKLQTGNTYYWQIADQQYILLTVFINIYYCQYPLTNCKPAIYIIEVLIDKL